MNANIKEKIFKVAAEHWKDSKECGGESSVAYMYEAFGMIRALSIIECKDLGNVRREWYDWMNNLAKAKNENNSDDEYYYEAVEVCPHCMSENTYPMWDTEVSGFVANCNHCGKEILLCDECQHTILEDGEVHDCDWCEIECGGMCHRGITHD